MAEKHLPCKLCLHSKSGKTLSVENIQSLNAAYTTIPSYSNEFDESCRTGRSRTLGRITTLSLSHGTSPHRHKERSNVMSSSPNLSMMSSNFMQDGVNMKRNRDGNSAGSSLYPINGEGRSSSRNSSGDFVLQLQQENETLRREIDLKESKLQSNMNSIKTFWSPELKKERALRKDESFRIATLQEQLKVAQDENQHSQLTMQALQDELRAQRGLNQLLQDDFESSHKQDGGGGFASSSLSAEPRLLTEENERLTRENGLLQQTMEEMETRIEAQRETLATRDESVRKLLEMLQSKGVSASDEFDVSSSVEVDALRVQLADYESQLAHMEMRLHGKDREFQAFKQAKVIWYCDKKFLFQKNAHTDCEADRITRAHLSTQYSNDVFEDSSKIKALQSLLEVKETKITSLERIIRELENEVDISRQDGAITTAERQEEAKQLEAYKTHNNFLKAKVDQLKSDVQKRDTELLTLQTRLDTANNQQSDYRQRIDVLKESLLAKEQGASILQGEVDSLRSRLDEKQQVLDQKQEQLIQLQEGRSSSESELSHLRDTLDVKDRKIAVLYKKIESLMEVVREKDRELEATKDRMSSLQQDSSSFDCNISTMEEALARKDEEVQCLRSEKVKLEERLEGETEELRKAKRNLEKRVESMQADLSDKNTTLNDVKEKASSFALSELKKDSRIKQLEISLQQKTEEAIRLDSQCKKLQQNNALEKVKEESKEKIEQLEARVDKKSEEATECQGNLDRLLQILKETENEKHVKDQKIRNFEKQVADLNAQVKSLNAKVIEEVKKKGAAQDKDMANLLGQLKERSERVEELELALRESVSITTDREAVLSKEEEKGRKLEKQMEELVTRFKQTKAILDETGGKLMSTEASLHEKERCIHQMRVDRRNQLEEVLEMKQEALLAAISEKDANIALLELSQSRKKTNAEEVCLLRREKDRLVQELKQQTQNRLKLLQENYEEPPLPPHNKRQHGNGKPKHGSRQTEDDGEGIWA